MQKKLLAGLVPLLAIAAFAVVPAAAQAEPHWYIKSKLVEPIPVPLKSGGALTLNTLGASIKCKVADVEEVWNPVGGGAGQDLMTTFVLSACKNKVATAACPKGAIPVKAEALPWLSHLVSIFPGPVIRDEIQKARILVGCAGTSGTVGDEFEGSLSPEVGVNSLIFGPGSGTLTDPSANPLTVSGIDKLKASKGKVEANDP